AARTSARDVSHCPTVNRITNAPSCRGAIFNHGRLSGFCMPHLNNVLFSGNIAESRGGAIFNFGDDNGNSSPIIINATFAHNSAPSGGAVYSSAGNNGTSSPQLSNTILWGNSAITGTQIYNLEATPTLSYTLIQRDTNAIFTVNSIITYNLHILTDNPRFVDADGADNINGTPDDNLQLSNRSPAIDAGNNDMIHLSTDLAGNPRRYDDTGVVDAGNGIAPIIDLGVYERQNNSTPNGTGYIYLPLILNTV
ncbi:MAG: choice-of-anchor Q domain-containing protein, partial [Chloroflexota bacterium]